jgi:hypothetical protein
LFAGGAPMKHDSHWSGGFGVDRIIAPPGHLVGRRD